MLSSRRLAVTMISSRVPEFASTDCARVTGAAVLANAPPIAATSGFLINVLVVFMLFFSPCSVSKTCFKIYRVSPSCCRSRRVLITGPVNANCSCLSAFASSRHAQFTQGIECFRFLAVFVLWVGNLAVAKTLQWLPEILPTVASNIT